jgi:nucleoside-diphosphate-sugar epimerase
MSATDPWPEAIRTEEALDELMTRPSPALVDWARSAEGPLLVLGAGGKMGPSLCVLARRAAERAGKRLEVIAASRFADSAAREWLEARGVKTIAADLLERRAVEALPDAPRVVHLVGLKFGTTLDPALTWATNTWAPALVAERFAGSRIAALSTGNVYGLAPVAGSGSRETDPLEPHGEYAHAALARERTFEFFARRPGGARVVIIRLNYAVDLRYGVLVDIALKVHRGEPVDVTTGHLNCIWQGDANERILRALELASAGPTVLNLTGTRILAVRGLAERLGELLGRPARITGTEADTALVADASRAAAELGPPPTSVDDVLRSTAEWLEGGGRLLGKPTHFERRDGRY